MRSLVITYLIIVGVLAVILLKLNRLFKLKYGWSIVGLKSKLTKDVYYSGNLILVENKISDSVKLAFQVIIRNTKKGKWIYERI